MSAPTLARYVDDLQAKGRYAFDRGEVLAALGCTPDTLKKAVQRLIAARRLAAPRRGFFVIVPLEYRSAGSPPPAWFIDDLMRFHGRPYYVGLLSAAALHGAAHQQPQEFQVVTNAPLAPARAGRARIRFVTKRSVVRTPAIPAKTETGSMRVSTPEATAIDLVRYAVYAGHIGNVVRVLSELVERLDGKSLVEAARSGCELSVVQRLGYLLDRVAGHEVTEPLARWLSAQHPRTVLLRPDGRRTRGRRDERWQVLVNEDVDVEE